jgi:cellulose synthase/poly-beta-1,6-N-acetylglucosamine synthase-like glycosyltransferase
MTPPLAVATDGRLATISQQERDLEVSILMPCLNEAATIERCITKATHALRADGFRGEVIIGDNGSTDGSQEIARRLGARVIDVADRGYGAALQGGIVATFRVSSRTSRNCVRAMIS